MGDIVIKVCSFNMENDLECPKPNSVLSNNELQLYNNFMFDHKCTNFLAGRMASKKAISHFFPNLGYKNISVLNSIKKHNQGQPEISINNSSKKIGEISITHSGAFAYAIFHLSKPVGIDLEICEKRHTSFFQANFTEKERKNILELPSNLFNQTITYNWTAKEAITKVLGKGLSIPTTKIEVDYSPKNWNIFLNENQEMFKSYGKYNERTFLLNTSCLSYNNSKYFLTYALEIKSKKSK